MNVTKNLAKAIRTLAKEYEGMSPSIVRLVILRWNNVSQLKYHVLLIGNRLSTTIKE